MSNPFAYYEESLPVRQAEIGFDESADTGEGTSHEPRVPIVLPLKRGLFGGHVILEATRDQCEISGDVLAEPMVILREEAIEQMRVKSNKLVVYTSDGRKSSFRCRRDKHRELSLARLETWRRQRWHDAAGMAYQSVSELLKKNVIRPVLRDMIALTILHVLFMMFCLLMSLGQLGQNEMIVFLLVAVLIYAIPPTVTFALALALGMRQIWAVYATLALSLVPLGLGCLVLAALLRPDRIYWANPTGLFIVIVGVMILLPATVICNCIRAIVRYHSLKAVMEHERHEQSFQSSGRLFDQNNRITIDLK
ncbi:MAG: hypothetical protein FWH27_03535 [Planctomycetaceae bacterium]|nr:hypothetical protein [Planctomycetaceae bacterium]